MIKVSGLTKNYDDYTALKDLNLNVETGSIYGLIGVNGSGKTTLIKHLTGVLRQDSGEIEFDGQKVWDNIDVKQRIGYIPDEMFFFNSYTLKQEHSFFKNMYAAWNEELFNNMISTFGLKETNRLSKFSKGMQKQASFALVLSTTPDYLILDEPMDGLDPIMRKKVWSFVISEVAERQMTVLISSHNLRELEGICDAVGILSQGGIVFEGNLDDLKNKNADLKDMSLEEMFFYEMEGK